MILLLLAYLGGALDDKRHAYTVGVPRLNQWGLSGDWTIGEQQAVLNKKDGATVYRFHACDLHLVLRTGKNGGEVRFRVTIDGAAPRTNHGIDVDADGNGVVNEHRLYQLIRQPGKLADHTFEIQFLDPNVQAYAFTFG